MTSSLKARQNVAGHSPWRPSPAQPPRISSWALKSAMAISGMIWAVFAAIHLAGNMKIFQGAEAFNEYAHWLRHAFAPLLPAGFLLWALRIVLLIALITHVWAALVLWRRSAVSRRRSPGLSRRTRAVPLSQRGAGFMRFTGIAILLFLLLHLADLTLGIAPLAPDTFQGPTAETASAYQNLIASFSRPWAAATYAAMMLLLAIHIAHGARNVATDLGARGKKARALYTWIGAVIALGILIGNSMLPILVQAGVLS